VQAAIRLAFLMFEDFSSSFERAELVVSCVGWPELTVQHSHDRFCCGICAFTIRFPVSCCFVQLPSLDACWNQEGGFSLDTQAGRSGLEFVRCMFWAVGDTKVAMHDGSPSVMH
jgi:hypothetical protein